jgi:hypothetical protein
VAVGCEPALEKAHDGRVVFDDQDAHSMRKYNRVARGFTASTGAIPRKGTA